MFFQKYIFGETAVYYVEAPVEGHEGLTTAGILVYPAEYQIDAAAMRADSMIQAAFTGDEGLVDYTFGVTMRNRQGSLVKIEEQTADEKGVVTYLTDGKGNGYVHTLRYSADTGVFSSRVKYLNRTGKPRTLEMLQSVSLSGIAAPSKSFISTAPLTLHRMTSAWSRECRLKSDAFPSLGLDMSWARYGVKCEKWGQKGSMSNRGWYPFAVIEDENAPVAWGMTLEAPFSWQIEVYQEKETCALSGGLADYEFAQWRKEIPPGGSFETHEAFFTVKENLLSVCNAFVKEADSRLCTPAAEEDMPVLFNEYCTTWGCPSEENILNIIRALKPFPIQTFVIDCGWYKPDGRPWCNAIGDWQESAALFPDGVARAAEEIRGAGMTAGIWFEFEVAGRDSNCFSREELLLSRDGCVITSKNRRFLDLRKEETEQYLQERFLRFLQRNGFGYLKIDYNDTFGIGCDSEDSASPGEGGRQVAEESILWLEKIKNAVPEIVIENCSSGGSRIEPYRMGKVSMCSFSDAHECSEIPLVAANVSRVIPARQMQIWAVLRDGEPLSRTIYSLCAAMLGRICLSGDVLHLSQEKIACIREGLSFYGEIKEIIRSGEITEIDCDVVSYREQKGRQIYVKQTDTRRLVVVHALDFTGEIVLSGKLLKAYTDVPYEEEKNGLRLFLRPYHAGAFVFGR